MRSGHRTTLLDTYETERAPHVREYIELAVRLGRLIMALKPGMADPLQPQTLATPRPRLGRGAFDYTMAAAGHLAPQPMLADGRRLDDVVGYASALLLHPDAALVARNDVAVVHDGALRHWLDEVGARAALVRPDRYVQSLARSDAEAATLH